MKEVVKELATKVNGFSYFGLLRIPVVTVCQLYTFIKGTPSSGLICSFSIVRK